MRVAREDEDEAVQAPVAALVVATIALSSVSAEAADIRCRVPFDFTVKGRRWRPARTRSPKCAAC
jgi:hypothetical protein